MALKQTLESIKSKLNALVTYSNSVTSKSDTTIGDCVRSLAEGYGGGGSGQLNNVPDAINSDSYLAMLSSIKNDTCRILTKTFTVGFSNTEYEPLFETDLNEIHGFAMFCDVDSNRYNTVQNMRVLILTRKNGSVFMAGNSLNNGIDNASQGFPFNPVRSEELKVEQQPLNGSIKFVGGNCYFMGRYNRNASYQLLATNLEYTFVVW